MLIKDLDRGFADIMAKGKTPVMNGAQPVILRDVLVDIALFPGFDRSQSKVQRQQPNGMVVVEYPPVEVGGGALIDNYDLASAIRDQNDVELTEAQVESLKSRCLDLHESRPMVCGPVLKFLSGKETPALIALGSIESPPDGAE